MKILIEKIGKEQNDYLLNVKKGDEIWCTESKLKTILESIFKGDEIISNKQIILNNKKYFPDYRIPSKKIIIEYQGYQHFTNSRIVYNDYLRKEIFTSNGWMFIEVFYFIQLTKEVMTFLFPMINKNLIQDFSNGYPHGFVHPKSIVIGDFCNLGLKKVISILKNIPDNIVQDCFKSLEFRALNDNVPIDVYNPIYQKIYKKGE